MEKDRGIKITNVESDKQCSIGVVSSSAFLCEIHFGTESWKTVILAEDETDIPIKAAEQYGNVRCEIIDVYDWF
jgi:hypothetical protein